MNFHFVLDFFSVTILWHIYRDLIGEDALVEGNTFALLPNQPTASSQNLFHVRKTVNNN